MVMTMMRKVKRREERGGGGGGGGRDEDGGEDDEDGGDCGDGEGGVYDGSGGDFLIMMWVTVMKVMEMALVTMTLEIAPDLWHLTRAESSVQPDIRESLAAAPGPSFVKFVTGAMRALCCLAPPLTNEDPHLHRYFSKVHKDHFVDPEELEVGRQGTTRVSNHVCVEVKRIADVLPDVACFHAERGGQLRQLQQLNNVVEQLDV